MTWTLAIDESGAFKKRKAPVRVGGILFNDGRGWDENQVTFRLWLASGGQPWPVHAFHVAQLAMIPLLHMVRKDNLSVPPEADYLFLAANHMRERCPNEYEAALNDVRNNRRPTRPTLTELKKAFDTPPADKEAAAKWQVARDLCKTINDQNTVAVKQVAASLQGLAFAVMAAESKRGELYHEEDRNGDARYKSLLTLVVSRAAELLHAKGMGTELNVEVLHRPMYKSRFLNDQQLQQLAPQVDGVTINIRSAGEYDWDQKSIFVLADHVCFHSFAVENDYPLERVERMIADYSGLSLRVKELPALAAAGAPASVVENARLGKSNPVPPQWKNGVRKWAVEQAEELARCYVANTVRAKTSAHGRGPVP